MALEDTEVDGIARPKGTILFLLVGSANRDPARFDKPDELVIERTENANRSIMFGGGIH
jgi:cytochrome P450